MKGKLNKRVNKSLLNLIKYSFRMRYIEESHEASKRMSFNNVEVINKTNFKVKSKDGVKLYDVSKSSSDVQSILAK